MVVDFSYSVSGYDLPEHLKKYEGWSNRFLRNAFKFGKLSVDDIICLYKNFVHNKLIIVLKRWNYTKGCVERKGFYARKRGDFKYSDYLVSKFTKLVDCGSDLVYFSRKDRGSISGSCLLMTLEYDSNIFSLNEAWERIGYDINCFVSRLKGKYGKVEIVRVNEGHKSHYPHLHCLLIFRDMIFSGRRMYSRRERKVVNRVTGADYRKLKTFWKHGFSDVRMIDSFKSGVMYLCKYLAKGTYHKSAGVQGLGSLALQWLFRKRSYGISRSLLSSDEREVMSNSISKSFPEDSLSPIFNSIGFDIVGDWVFDGFLKVDHKIIGWRDGNIFDSKRLLIVETKTRLILRRYEEFDDGTVWKGFDKRDVNYFEYDESKFPDTGSEKIVNYL